MDRLLTQHRQADSPASITVNDALFSELSGDTLPVSTRQVAADLIGTLGAGVAGTAVWSLSSKTRYGIVARLAATAVLSGTSKVGLKAASESILLPSRYHTAAKSDFVSGILDGFAGLAACKADQAASAAYTRRLGFQLAGRSLTKELAVEIGEKALTSSVKARVFHAGVRGTAGAFVGSLAWSTPHSLYNHRAQLHCLEGWSNAGKEIAIGTGIGTVFGAALCTGVGALANSREIAGYAAGKLKGDRSITRVDVLHFNDTHSALIGERASLPQLATEAARLQARSAARGRTPMLFELGDNYSGNVVAGFTDVGYVETRAVAMMKPTALIPGNHVADVGMGGVDVAGWVRNIHKIERELGPLPALATNLEIPAFPGFIGPAGSYKPYKIVEAMGKGGRKEQIGLISLVTDELEAVSDRAIVYKPHLPAAEEAISALNAQGVNKVIVLSHLGRSTDIQLARSLRGRVAAVIGAHTHDIEPVPLWVRNTNYGADIPIVQAGSKAGWLGELNLAIKADGTADRYRTFGRLHEIHEGIKPDASIKAFIESRVGSVSALENRVYNVRVTEPFHHRGIRGEDGRQTPLGSLITRSLHEGVNEQLPGLNQQRAGLEPLRPIEVVIKHSGDIRDGVTSPVNHLKLSNLFLNTGTPERELTELCAIQVSGEQLKRILAFSVHDLPDAVHTRTGLAADIRSLFSRTKQPPVYDYSGNFIHVEGLRYSFDRSLPANRRITSVEFFDQSLKKYVPIDPNRNYEALTLFHPVDKWGKYGMLTQDPSHPMFNSPDNWVYRRKMSSAEARALVNARSVPLSQVDLVARYLQRQSTASPAQFLTTNITDVTRLPWEPPVKIRFSPMIALQTARPVDLNQQAAERR